MGVCYKIPLCSKQSHTIQVCISYTFLSNPGLLGDRCNIADTSTRHEADLAGQIFDLTSRRLTQCIIFMSNHSSTSAS